MLDWLLSQALESRGWMMWLAGWPGHEEVRTIAITTEAVIEVID